MLIKLKTIVRGSILSLILCVVTSILNSTSAQDTSIIKNMILRDVFLLNEIYESKIVSNQSQKNIIINAGKIVDSFYLIPSEKLDVSSIIVVELKKLDSELFSVKIRFDNIFGMLSDKEFEYVIFQSGDRNYRIDGFFVCDVFLLKKSELRSLGLFLSQLSEGF